MLCTVCAWLEETELNFKLVERSIWNEFLVGKLLPFFGEMIGRREEKKAQFIYLLFGMFCWLFWCFSVHSIGIYLHWLLDSWLLGIAMRCLNWSEEYRVRIREKAWIFETDSKYQENTELKYKKNKDQTSGASEIKNRISIQKFCYFVNMPKVAYFFFWHHSLITIWLQMPGPKIESQQKQMDWNDTNFLPIFNRDIQKKNGMNQVSISIFMLKALNMWCQGIYLRRHFVKFFLT